MKRSITELLQERFGDPIGSESYIGDVSTSVYSDEPVICPACGMENCKCQHIMDEGEICNKCSMMKVEGSCGCMDEMAEAKKKKGLWDNIHARRKAGKKPKRPGAKGYPKTLDV